jgi:sugar porter (SP) family MFS transporter
MPGFTTFGLPECIKMTEFEWGLVQSSFTVGGFFGAIFTGAVSTGFGRLFALKWSAFFLAAGPLAEALAAKIWVLALGRALSGIGAGAATVVGPIYIAEVSPQKQRGFFGTFTQVQINLGIVVAQLLGYFLSSSTKWRWILASGGYIAGVLFFGLNLIEETPKWLAANDRPRRARMVLQRLRGKNAETREEIDSWDVSGQGEEEPLLRPHQEPPPQKPSTKTIIDVIRIPKYRRAVIAVVGTMMAQQLTGINSVVMYSVSVLDKILPNRAGLITVLVSSANVLVTMLASPLPDRIGRKNCLIHSISGMGLGSALLFAGLEQDLPWLTVAAITIFVTSFGIGLGPVPFILTTELVGPEAVGAVSSWALASNWLSTFLVSMFFPVLHNALGTKVWWIFTGLATFWATFVGVYVPESKDKATAEEVWQRQLD